jgi:hypothetical protein
VATKLTKYTVSKSNNSGKWDLRNDQTNKVERSFKTKADVLKGGTLKRAVGAEGGSVKIKGENGRIQEERTYPGSKDPRKSKG